MIKVLHIITGLGPGGAQSCLLNILKNKDKNISHGVISLGRGNIYEEKIKNLTEFYVSCPVSFSPKLLGQTYNLFKAIKYFSPHIIQTWLYHADLIATIVYIFLKNKPKLIWSIRCSDMAGRYDKGKNFLLIKLLSILSFLPDKIIYNSKSGIISHETRGYKKEKSSLIYNGIDTETFKKVSENNLKEKLGIRKKIFLFGLIGRDDPIKGHDDFLKALAKVSNSHGILVGDGITSSIRIRDEIDKLNISHKVSLLEQQDNIQNIISSLDLLVSASFSEGFPTVIAEAMSCETAVIATNAGDSSDIIGKFGVLIEPGNYMELSNKMKEFIRGTEIERNKNNKNLRERIRANFSSINMYNRYNETYNLLFNKK